jgi:hypothetical protein
MFVGIRQRLQAAVQHTDPSIHKPIRQSQFNPFVGPGSPCGWPDSGNDRTVQRGQNMTDVREARLVFLTDPERGVTVLNVQVGDEEIQRFQINRNHLFDLNHQAADILVKEFK